VIRVYRITGDGRRRELSRLRVRSDEPYQGPIGGEWPACRCPRHALTEGERATVGEAPVSAWPV
jgi:hypothetical protein